MSKVVVIGAGASGVVAALKASMNNEVIILESNDKILKKLLLTGNGKCNYWNEDININKYSTDDIDKLKNILKYKDDTLNFLYNLGLYPKIKNGYYYPYSESSSSVREIFIKNLKKSNVKIITNFKVENIEYNNKFIIKSKDNTIICDKLIIATGSKAYPKTGSDGSGYKIVKKFKHNINTVLPSLVPLKLDSKYLKECDGVRLEANLKLIVDKKEVKQELGEIQITNYGISGICTFNISGLAIKYLKKAELEIDFLPKINNVHEFINDRSNKLKGTIEEILESIFNYKLLLTLLKISNISKDKRWQELTKEEQQKLCNTIKNYKVKVIGSLDFDRAQTCSGGVPLKEINESLQSNNNKNLYLIGEILDINGDCGGYNLGISFITGYIAGGSLNDSN